MDQTDRTVFWTGLFLDSIFKGRIVDYKGLLIIIIKTWLKKQFRVFIYYTIKKRILNYQTEINKKNTLVQWLASFFANNVQKCGYKSSNFFCTYLVNQKNLGNPRKVCKPAPNVFVPVGIQWVTAYYPPVYVATLQMHIVQLFTLTDLSKIMVIVITSTSEEEEQEMKDRFNFNNRW